MGVIRKSRRMSIKSFEIKRLRLIASINYKLDTFAVVVVCNIR